ncbi:DUF4280 domain-containing protein [Desulfosporosinus sp. PR]|uniref:DUF4280 domain-containing protein n=1 Tax=Candidatus Desulfosporosinus nitrosoreducens TaxID=3401928 RepID=UPI0027FE47A7|nr:DUF4280 domain-containing protein [Desulfosporosinus sp. PR]MDQ7096743.1 DUF4280 domain-containing protein [Desulfosporosinus sp. PR]
MGMLTVNTALCTCSFGAAPVPLLATSAPTVLAVNQPAATIMDLPALPFGLCTSLANPAVASATAAALGVLTPMPCTPMPAPWLPGSPTVLIGGKPALNNSSKAICSFGGVIQITMTPAMTVQVP